jgi:hypothetical protein
MFSRRQLFTRLSAIALTPLVKLLPKKSQQPAQYIWSCKPSDNLMEVGIRRAGVYRLPAARSMKFIVTGNPEVLRDMTWEYDGYECMSFSDCKVFSPIPQEEA